MIVLAEMEDITENKLKLKLFEFRNGNFFLLNENLDGNGVIKGVSHIKNIRLFKNGKLVLQSVEQFKSKVKGKINV